MPRPRVQTSGTPLSPGQAAYVLERLVADRRISKSEVNRYVAEMAREIKELEARLQNLRSVSDAAAPAARRPRRGNGATAKKARAVTAPAKRRQRAGKLTPEMIESRKLQGRYLSLIRRIPANKRAQYKKLASEKGRETAIREMKAAVGK